MTRLSSSRSIVSSRRAPTCVDTPVGPKLELRDAAERGDVLILFSDRLPQQVELDVTGHLRQIARVNEVALVLVERLEQGRREAARRSQTGSCGDVRQGRDLDVRTPRSRST